MTDVVELLQRLIAVDTHNPGGDEPRLCADLGVRLRALGGDVRVETVTREGGIGAYVIATWGRPRLIINAHVDTVPPNEGWSHDPFAARVEGGRVYGLGACDTKAAIAATLCALEAVPGRDLAVIFSGDEENTGTVVRAALERERQLLGDVKRAIVCEPTSLRAGVRHRGILALEARIDGRGGHSSRADHEPAALLDAARLAVAFGQWGQAQRARGPSGFAGMCLNIAKLDGGIAFNVIPSEARLSLSVRPPPGSDVDKVRDELIALAATVVPRARLTAPISNPTFATRDRDAFFAELGAPVDLAFWTEAALWSEMGIDCVVWGPGDIAHAHAPNEFVPIVELQAARDVLTQVLTAHGSG
jgi:acetylornithine deacetylase